MNIVMNEPDVVLNTFCVTRFCHPEIFQFLKDNVLSIMFNQPFSWLESIHT